jgi:NodT family efflux transporter outer membrane factor (OMF) lipoprotein
MMPRRPIAALLIPALLAGCSFAPTYHRPAIQQLPASFKEAPGWRTAAPSDDVARGEWWTLLGDPVLDDLEKRVFVSNQNIAAAVAAYDQARASVREQRAALFPTIDLSSGANKVGSFGSNTVTVGSGQSGVSSSGSQRYTLTLGATWEPDLWGAIRNSVKQAGSLAQASKADLANATLSAQGELATNYLQLRSIEAQQAILDATVAAYQRALTITNNRYTQGVVAKVDVLEAETQLRNAKASGADLVRQRAILEHAIAVLIGENPSTYSLPAAAWNRAVPEIPAILPGELLERRPDVAGAERRVAAANAAIGIQRAAFFPTIGLSGDVGSNSRSIGKLFDAASSVWSLGLTGALTLLDFGARSARVSEARAAYHQTVAEYRQAVLTAFQQTEDSLAALRVLEIVQNERSAAAVAANRVEQLTQNQYLAGQISYTDVITAQATALNARQAEVQTISDRQVAAVALIQAIGGQWSGPAPAAEQTGVAGK